MCSLQSVANLNCNIHQWSHWHRLRSSEEVMQVISLQQLHRNEWLALMLLDFIDGANVGMVQSRRGLRFAFETLKGYRIARQFFRQKFQRHAPSKLEVFCFEDHSHTSTSDCLQYAVVGDGFSEEEAQTTL